MVQSKATTVDDYLDQLPDERREVVAKLRKFILKNLPKGYAESMAFGMIGYGIPLSKYPKTYNGQPLSFAALAAQKNYYALYLMPVYGDEAAEKKLRDGFAREGKKLDIGKSCIRFKKVEDLALDALAEAIRSTPPEALIAKYEASRKR
ncbi:MAG: DUF1801 domain-containing protein [Thermoanaerobaculia bacterium]